MMTIMFGSIPTPIMLENSMNHKNIADKAITAPVKNWMGVQIDNRANFRRVIEKERCVEASAFAKLEQSLASRTHEVGPVGITRVRGGFTLKPLRGMRLKNFMDKQTSAKEREDFLRAEDSIIHKLSIPEKYQKEYVCDDPIRNNHALTKSTKQRAKPRKIAKCSEHALDNLVRAVSKIAKKRDYPIWLCGNRSNKPNVIVNDQTHGKIIPRLLLRHMCGKYNKRDVKTNSLFERFKHLYAVNYEDIPKRGLQLQAGTSGIICRMETCPEWSCKTQDEYIIIRGRLNGTLIDARKKLRTCDVMKIKHYSVADKFWNGYSETYVKHKPTNLNHVCTSGFDVSECGQVAALLTQLVFPSGRITCIQCAYDHAIITDQEFENRFGEHIQTMRQSLEQHHPSFKHVLKLADKHCGHIEQQQTSYNAFGRVKQIIGDRKTPPFSHLNQLNEFLIKGKATTSDEVSKAYSALEELARFQKNRTDNIQSGALDHYRNKVSSKSHINLDLMCDNQLDKNGNFQWGQRGYHAKRFFENYFNVVDAGESYKNHATRKNPNGSRELAIGSLIVSTNLETFRQRMAGVPVQRQPITIECVSIRDGAYIYPCSCVTTELGQPLFSTFMMPTKHHLVLGNTGDRKYVQLPVEEPQRMYIAKDGYCHINIFLSMLVNISEDLAKSFTKMVRDMIMPALGSWPTMMDVATACYMLTVFYPDTAAAELPTILIDHEHKIMHVVDSYGSANTGYHVLKANTINQLIAFTNEDVKSELKHYRVGGGKSMRVKYMEGTQLTAVKLLMKGIYKPAVMQTIIEQEPFLLILAMVSPSVIKALYRSKALERAMRVWVTSDQNVADIFAALTVLATKVTCARALMDQFNLLEKSADSILKLTDRTFTTHHSVYTAQHFLMRVSEQVKMDCQVELAGFVTYSEMNRVMLEKNYQEQLRAQWQELSFVEKLQVAWQSPGCLVPYTANCQGNAFRDLTTTSTTFISARVGNTKETISSGIGRIHVRARKLAHQSIGYLVCRALTSTKLVFGNLKHVTNILVIISTLIAILSTFNKLLSDNKKAKQFEFEKQQKSNFKEIRRITEHWALKNKTEPTIDEIDNVIVEQYPHLVQTWNSIMNEKLIETKFQAKSIGQKNLERVIAFTALALMLFDAERSDCVYQTLNKLKGIFTTMEIERVNFQSLDEVQSILDEKKMTVDLELGTTDSSSDNGGVDFEHWWAAQLNSSRVVPHYRTEGFFMEFKRETAAAVAAEIAHNPEKDILIRGAVGSGKSTGLPFHLSKKGNVLMLEPTKPLAENVCKQLRGQPFLTSATLKMRGCSVFGSAPITIMTSGYALHFFAHNPHLLQQYSFIIFDECHAHDAAAMAFRCALAEFEYAGKILKVSATPPGQEVEFSTQHPVKIVVEASLSIQQFAAAQGTGSNPDATKYGDNILVYVASYNEVDLLSKLLIEKHYKVTKVDGRSMKVGNVEILTSGTHNKKHYIVATNIIENGVTLDVDVVADFGVKVEPDLDVDLRMIKYRKVAISYGERIQRLGRVGRFKEGTAIRIGHTEKGLSQIPVVTATEAAFMCFTYGLPVMTSNVSLNLLNKCTVRQARTAMQFEISPLYMINLIRYDGSMHPVLYKLFTQYKLRDSETPLNKMAIPNQAIKNWLTAKEYAMAGAKLDVDEQIRIPFHTKDIPAKLHESVWDCISKFKGDAGFGRLTLSSASKVAYTLQTDPASLQRTLFYIDRLIEAEMQKKSYFESVTSVSCLNSSINLLSISNAIKARHMQDYTTENISVLQAAKQSLLEFKNINLDLSDVRGIMDNGALECINFQSEHEISKQLALKGKWNKSLITQDVVIAGGVLIGGAIMAYTYLKDKMNEVVIFQAGKGKRQRQKLQFREARDNKMGREVYGNDDTIEMHFGNAYTAKGKVKGKFVKGMGNKTRRFINMYGFDPTEYSFARYVDPLTGATLDESVIASIDLVQDHFGQIRNEAIDEGLLEPNAMRLNQQVNAYFVNNKAKKVLKIDLTPHNPLRVCDKSISIAGYPERENELRQTGPAQIVPLETLPEENERGILGGGEKFESKSTFQGPRDYNSISSTICLLENDSDGVISTLHGIGYGSIIITNQHLFRQNNGELTIKSKHGQFKIPNTTQMRMYPIEGRDIVLLQMPKDFPPFPSKLKFREPIANERVCLVGTNLQEKSLSSTVSESSIITQKDNTNFFRHWITTKDGQCGLPMVSPKDGNIVGIHSMTSTVGASNFFVAFPRSFEQQYLNNLESLDWTKKWKLNIDKLNWGAFSLQQDKPTKPFEIMKDIFNLSGDGVLFQGVESWIQPQLKDNLVAVGRTTNQLVTKHVVRGKCTLFQTYMALHEEANQFFSPLLGAYNKSALNKNAYIKDFTKYDAPTIIGVVNSDRFERAVEQVITMLHSIGFEECNYVTDTDEIFSALNMKAAVGALYGGKKKDYFENYTSEMKENILEASCRRLFTGKMGVWNGSLKAELRPIEKVLANKTRSFTAAPLDTLLGGKVCVDDFNNQFYSKNLQGPWSVGMTKFYGGWNELMNQLPDGWTYCDADGSQFDSSLTPYLINAVLLVRLAFMEDWDLGEQMLANLYTEIIYTPIATPDGTIVKKHKGNNSGQPSTVVDNTLMVIIAMYYSMSMLGFEDGFDDVCKFFVNGDDLILAVRNDMKWILPKLSELFNQLGLKYDFTSVMEEKTDLWFMSHRAIPINGILIPKLEPERIVSILEWDRATLPEHRLEAISAAMIEAWGYTELLQHIRKFYYWMLEQEPYKSLAEQGKAPYIAETALKRLYCGGEIEANEIETYLRAFDQVDEFPMFDLVQFQATKEQQGPEVDAGQSPDGGRRKLTPQESGAVASKTGKQGSANDKDVDVGTSGSFSVPRLKKIGEKMNLPKIKKMILVNLDHLITYEPDQVDISNTRATHNQLEGWYQSVKDDYNLQENEMKIVLNGFMVWCIENGTSPNINGSWTMMDGDEQVEYSLKPMVEHAKPTLRQIMAHFSPLAEAYIEKRNATKPYMPRYGLQRNLRDYSLARYAFDFFEMNSKTPVRAREAHIQMKAAALRNVNNRLFGLDGNVGTQEENTERHTTNDVNRDMHSLLGMGGNVL